MRTISAPGSATISSFGITISSTAIQMNISTALTSRSVFALDTHTHTRVSVFATSLQFSNSILSLTAAYMRALRLKHIMLSCNARNRKHRRLPTCLTRRIPFSPHLACAFPPHLIPLPPCTSTLHVLVRGVDSIPYKPWHSTSSSHSHSFSPRTHGFSSTTIPAVINNK